MLPPIAADGVAATASIGTRGNQPCAHAQETQSRMARSATHHAPEAAAHGAGTARPAPLAEGGEALDRGH
eukprot:1090102-Alexandrium_andersonii.AAC.1